MVFLLTLVSCRFKSDFLFFMDPYTWEALKSRSIEWKQLKSLLHDTGYRMRPVITEPGENSEALLTDTIKENNPGQVFISSLFPFDIASFASRYPQILFIQEAGPASSFNPGSRNRLSAGSPSGGLKTPNLVRIIYERNEALHLAGELVGRLFGDPSFERFFQSHFKKQYPRKAGILFYSLSETSRLEAAAFKEGFIKAADPGLLVVQEIDNLEDRAKARRLLEKMKEDGVVITLLKTYTLNTFCLDFMQKEGGLAVIEDWTGFRVYEDVVLMSVEEDFIDTLKNLLNTRSESGPAGRRAASVKGTVRLKWGKAFDLPYEIKREADDGP